MAVFTEVSEKDARDLLRRMSLGSLKELRGIQGGIENTNYFLTTDQGEWVLTLFERLTAEQLPFYLYLMKHLAGRDYERQQPNLRSLPWWNETVPTVIPHIDAPTADLLRSELAFQNHVAASPAHAALPRGPVHADLFRDNVMFEGERLTGFFDFYFAGVDSWLFDLAVCLNDWCIELATGAHDAARAQAMIDAYQSVRPLTAAERELFNPMLRAGALRFWISRLWDFHLPREASMLVPHDPTHFERVLRQRLAHPVALA
jgi:homoserine kinase type II